MPNKSELITPPTLT